MTKIHDPRLDYKTHKEKTVEKTERGPIIDTYTKFDGSVDKTVKVQAIKLNMSPNDFSPQHLKAFQDVQEASRHFLIAKHSNDPEMVRKAKIKLERANVRLLEVQ